MTLGSETGPGGGPVPDEAVDGGNVTASITAVNGTRIYGSAALDYHAAGWGDPLPLPYRAKNDPPAGFTGHTGSRPDIAQIREWTDRRAQCNIGMRLLPGYISLDPDTHKGPAQLDAWQDQIHRCGPLPDAPRSTSRGFDGDTGNRLFRVPDGYRAVQGREWGEIIQHHHRYVVVWPSIVKPPDGNSQPYQWESGQIPSAGDIPWLPQAWLDDLRDTRAQPASGQVAQFTQPATGWIGDPVTTGSRHDAIVAYAGRLRARGIPLAEAAILVSYRFKDLDHSDGKYTIQDALAKLQDVYHRYPAGDLAADETGDSLDLAVTRRVAQLRVDQRAREQLAAEHTPAMPGILDGARFLAQPLPPVRWRIDQVMPAGSNIILFAQYKAGKTTLVGNLIRSWCDSTPFLGQFAITPAGGPILLIDTEMPAGTAQRWLAEQQIADATRFKYVNIRGQASVLNMLSPVARQTWAQLAAGCSAVLLDCAGPVLGALGLDESVNPDVIRWFAGWDEFLALAGITESFTVHHMGHTAERGRGASRFRDWPDAEWQLVRQDDNPASPRYFKAYGRDVDLAETRLAYDSTARHLAIAGGNRREVAEASVLADVTALLAVTPDMSGNQLELALSSSHGRNHVRSALAAAARTGDLAISKGPRNATLYTLSSPVRRTSPLRSGEVASSSPPPIRGANWRTETQAPQFASEVCANPGCGKPPRRGCSTCWDHAALEPVQ